jgi:hypothetical protein
MKEPPIIPGLTSEYHLANEWGIHDVDLVEIEREQSNFTLNIHYKIINGNYYWTSEGITHHEAERELRMLKYGQTRLYSSYPPIDLDALRASGFFVH